MKLCKPDWYQKKIFTINYDKLKEEGIKYLVFDLDNTLGFIDQEKCSFEVIELMKKLSSSFTIIVASNNSHKRVLEFCKGITSNIISMALKPSARIYRYMKKYTTNMQEVCIIGDQIITDIIAGNRFLMKTILVDPLGEKDLKITSFNRYLERKIIKRINLVKGQYYEKN